MAKLLLKHVVAGCIFWGFALLNSASALTIDASISSLGANQYRIDYILTNTGLETVSLIDIYFDPGLYDESSLQIVSAADVASRWDESILGSAPSVDAAYDIFATSGGLAPSASDSGFAVQFLWLGAGLPGSQDFEVYDPSSFDLLQSGQTAITVVPLPPPLFPLLSGIAILYFRSRQKAR